MAREILSFSERFEVEHREFLTEFDEQVWPMYRVKGFSRDTALIAWLILGVQHSIDRLEEVSDAEDEGGNSRL